MAKKGKGITLRYSELRKKGLVAAILVAFLCMAASALTAAGVIPDPNGAIQYAANEITKISVGVILIITGLVLLPLMTTIVGLGLILVGFGFVYTSTRNMWNVFGRKQTVENEKK